MLAIHVQLGDDKGRMGTTGTDVLFLCQFLIYISVIISDSISSDSYEAICEKLIQQFKVLHGSLRGVVSMRYKIFINTQF